MIRIPSGTGNVERSWMKITRVTSAVRSWLVAFCESTSLPVPNALSCGPSTSFQVPPVGPAKARLPCRQAVRRPRGNQKAFTRLPDTWTWRVRTILTVCGALWLYDAVEFASTGARA